MQAKIFLLSMALGSFIPAAFANPVLDNVAAGTAEVHSTASHVQITQQTPQAVLNWHSFNIGAAESVHFQQPANGIALNRVHPAQGASEIAGRLSATGRLIIVNPAGIHFHGTAQVDVAGLLVTTGNISNKNFLAGNYRFEDNSGLGGSVTNAGKINASEHGFVAFMAPHIENSGHITAHLDQVALYSTTKFTLKFGQNGLVHFAVADHLVKEGVREKKFIANNNGRVLVPASTAKSVLDNAIHVPEQDVARSVYVENGKIIFSAQIETPQKVIAKTTSTTTSSSSTATTEKERPQSAMSNHSDSDFEIITNPERPPRLDLAISQPDDADWEIVDSPHPGINFANKLGANWEVIDSPRLSDIFSDDDAGHSPRFSTSSVDSLSPLSQHESDSVKIITDQTGTSIDSPHLDEMASYLAQNPDLLTDSLTLQTSASPHTPVLSIDTQSESLQAENQAELSSPISVSDSDSDYIEVLAANLSDSYDSDFDEFVTPLQNKLYRIKILKSIYDTIDNSVEIPTAVVSPKFSNDSNSLDSGYLPSFTLTNEVRSALVLPVINTIDKERPQSAMTNHSDSDFEIIRSPKRPPHLVISQHDDADGEIVDSPHHGINFANKLGANWEVIDSPRLSEIFSDDDAGHSPLNLTPRSLQSSGSLTPQQIDADWLTINQLSPSITLSNHDAIPSPRSVHTADSTEKTTIDTDWVSIDSPHFSTSSLDSLSPRSVHAADEAHWMAVDPLTQSITYAEQESPRSMHESDLLSAKLLTMPIDEMASHIAQNPDLLTDSLTLQTKNQSQLLSPISDSDSDDDSNSLGSRSLSSFTFMNNVPAAPLLPVINTKLTAIIPNQPSQPNNGITTAIVPAAKSITHTLTNFTLMNNVIPAPAAHALPMMNTPLTTIIPNQPNEITTAIVSTAKSITHNRGNTIAAPLFTACKMVKYKFDAGYLSSEREKCEIFSEAFLSDYKIHMPEIIIIR
jgi:filamentous hemagglutinin family protein